jgi:hypothetical protein
MLQRYTLATFVLLIFAFFPAPAQDSLTTKKIKILPVPTIGYTPETKTYLGAVALFTLRFYQDANTRTSNAKIELNYTWNQQLIVETQWNYFFREEKWFTRGLIHFSKYPDIYFGVGADTPAAAELKFESNRSIVDVDWLKQIGNSIFLGAGIRYLRYDDLSFNENANPFPELKNSSTIGLKLIFLKDKRNNILNATGGSYFELVNTHNKSDDYYSLVSLDVRKYFIPGNNPGHVVAGRFFTSFVFGDPAFYDYSLMGGDRFVRGYFYGRYRDHNFSTLQMEYRLRLFWRLGMAAFGGMSMIYEDFAGISSDTYKPNGGIGLRFLVDKTENTNLRLDYAVGAQGQDGFYITFGESF